MIKVGLIVNPIAGMGGNVGLKGTDGKMYEKALKLGAEPVSPIRIKNVLDLIKRKDLYFLCAPGKMGEEYLLKHDFDYKVIGKISENTCTEDTKRIAKKILEENIKLLIFVGGDGTARDILDIVGMDTPVIAIPSGVKMFSSVFTFSPHAAAEMINSFGEDFTEKEILDIDEDAFRENRLDAKFYGTVKVPNIQHLLQGKKAASNIKEVTKNKKQEVAEYIVENMEKDTLYILGPGTTLKAIADELKIEKTLLGIDAVSNCKLVGGDINEKEILDLMKKYKKTKIIITPIGGNGFIFGRGSKQISYKVLKVINKQDIIVVGTLDKVGGLDGLRVDTGDYEVDTSLGGEINVIVGYNEELLMEVKFD